MEITLTEALRIKNELSNIVKQLNYNTSMASFGVTTEDGEVISEDSKSFADAEDSLIKGLAYSFEINNAIATFNKTSNVDQKVRKMQNAKLLLDVYSRNLDKTKAKKNKKFENLGTVRKMIQVEYTPSVTGKDLKEKISIQKSSIRTLQSEVEKLNLSKISVGFEYSDIENLIG